MKKAFWLVLALGCGSDDKTSEDTGTDGVGGDDIGAADFGTYIDTTVMPVGDLACAAGSLGTESPMPGCNGRMVTMNGTVEDFQTGDPVEELKVEIFQRNEVAGVPDFTGETDINGVVSTAMPTCAPFTYQVQDPNPAADQTRRTIQAHNVLAYATTSTVNFGLNSVSSSTYALIPAIFGVNPAPGKGIVAGRSYDCDEDNLEGMQVVVKTASGVIPAGMLSGYFVDEFPSKEQLETSADGLWLLMDVPPGMMTVEGYVYNGSSYDLVATTEIEVLADSINIASLYAGISDGVKYPSTCLEEACAR